MDGLRLPILRPSSAGDRPEPLSPDAAALAGLREVGPARAQGLFDRFGRSHTYLRISVTERCNLRCRYCMPEEGVELPHEGILSFEEIERLAGLFVRLGVRKIRLTGGEPLVRRGFPELTARLGQLKSHGLTGLAITTNALLLEPVLPQLVAAGVDAINISLDTLREDRFLRITGRVGCAQTVRAIHAAARALPKVKVNAVALAGVNDDELVELAAAFCREHLVEVRYIEYMPFEGLHWSEAAMVPAARIRELFEERLGLHPDGMDDGGAGVSQMYRVRERGGTFWRGRVGVIASVTEPFCATCSRLRLTADGKLRWCLLDEGEVELRGPLRAGASDAELERLVEAALGRKRAGHGPAPALAEAQRAAGPQGARAMIRIGG